MKKRLISLIAYIITTSTEASETEKKKSWNTYMFKSTGLIHEWLWYFQWFLFSGLISSCWNCWKAFTLSSWDSTEGRRRPRSYTAPSSLPFLSLCIGHGKKGWLTDLFPEYWFFSLSWTSRNSPLMELFPCQVHAEGVKQTSRCLCHPATYKRGFRF